MDNVPRNCGKLGFNNVRMKVKVYATAVGIQAARWQLGSPLLSSLWCPRLCAFKMGKISLLRLSALCQSGREGSTVVVEGHDQQGNRVSLPVLLAELAAW